MFERLLSALSMEQPSQYEEYYKDVSWKTFRVDDSIWNGSVFDRPGIDYYRQLQHCYMQVLNEMSNAYLYDSDLIRNEFNQIHLDNCRLEKELAIAQGTIEILKTQLASALEWQTATGRKNEVFTANGLDPEVETQKPKVDNKYVSADGRSKKEKMMEAAAMAEAGWSMEDIGTQLGISSASVNAYISMAKRHYTRISGGEGGDQITFDEEYGKKSIYLGVYDKPGNYSHQGRIVALA